MADEDSKSLTDRTLGFIEQKDAMDVVFDHIANGGALTELCETLRVRYSTVASWVQVDTDRRKRYNQAVEMRGEWFVERFLQELRAVGLNDLRSMVDVNGNLLPLDQMPASATRAIASIDITEEYSGQGEQRVLTGHTKKVKLWDKLKSLELIGKKLGMFIERYEAKVTLEDLVAESNKPPVTPAPKEPGGA